MQTAEKLLTSIKEKGPLGRKSPVHQKRKGRLVRIRVKRVASRQLEASRPLLINLKLRRMFKRPSGLHKLITMSAVHRISMKLESEFLDSLQIKAKTLQRNQSVRSVNDTPYT